MAHDEHGWETLDPKEAISFEDFKLKLNTDGSVIWSWKEERNYSEKEVLEILAEYGKHCTKAALLHSSRMYAKEWLNKSYPQ